MDRKKMSIEEIKQNINSLHENYKSVILSTINRNNEPYNSYAPYILHDNNFYILISETAPHFYNMVKDNQVSFMFIEDELKASNVFFRKRLSYYAIPIIIDSNEMLKNAFISKFGKMAEMVLKMDFHIVKLDILHGKVILGPGQAYYLDNNSNVVSQDVGKNNGHTKRKSQ